MIVSSSAQGLGGRIVAKRPAHLPLLPGPLGRDSWSLFMRTIKAMACVEPVALLKRSDANVVCFYSGADWQSVADRLGEGHCFNVDPVLVFPRAPIEMRQRVSEELKHFSVASGWFACSAGLAVDALVAVTRDAPYEASSDASTAASTDASCHSQCAPDPTCTPLATEAVTVSATSTAGSDDDASCAADSALWTLVERCNSASASKAGDVRASLRASLGKRDADLLLANTKTSVARRPDGRAFRMLRLDGHALRLKAD